MVLHCHKMIHKMRCDLWECPLRNKAGGERLTVQWVNPQKLTLVLFTMGRREGEFDSNRNEKTKSGHRSPPMPEFLRWLWQTLLVQHKALYTHCTSHWCGKTRTVGNIYSSSPEGYFYIAQTHCSEAKVGISLITASFPWTQKKEDGKQTQVQLTSVSLLMKVGAQGLRVEWSNTSGLRNEEPVDLPLSTQLQTPVSLAL